MEIRPKAIEKIKQLLRKGVDIPNPLTLDIGEEVDCSRISAKDVTLYPGCRIYGSKTVISSGCRLGYEAPATVENCLLGARVELKGGYFSRSVFLEKASMGLGAHVREGCILEEQACGAHCVGLKQTILFPFVTLGSLINFCDCLMAGGTSRQNHSEVGSAYIHFNFTPDADKTTPSLIGDVPRGVLLKQPPIFLGGQGGMVGPVRLGYGNVVAAGSILRHDHPGDNKLIFETACLQGVKDVVPATYPGFRRMVENNILYLANLAALAVWYRQVRKPFLEAQEFGAYLYDGAMEQLSLARKERIGKLKAMAEKAVASAARGRPSESMRKKQALHENLGAIEGFFDESLQKGAVEKSGDAFLRDFNHALKNDKKDYIEAIQRLPDEISSKGVRWLDSLVNDLCRRVSDVLPSLNLFKH